MLSGQGTKIYKKTLSVKKLRKLQLAEILEDIIAILVGTFAGGSELQGVGLSKKTEFIGDGAFENCFQLNS